MALPPLNERSLPDLIADLKRIQDALADLAKYKDREIQVGIANSLGARRMWEAIDEINAEISRRTG